MEHIAMEINGQLEENGEFHADDSDQQLYTKDGSKDLHGRPAIAAKTGRWRAAKYIIGNQGLNCLGFYGATTNLVVYFTNVLHQGNATAANNVEEVKFVLRVFPVWVTSILFSTVYVQMSTLFVEQGALMNTRVAGGALTLPAAAVSTFDTISVILWVPIYDRIIVRVASKWTGHPRGLTSLQRIGVGLAVSIFSMAAAAIVEVTRLRLAREEGVAATGQPVTGMSVFWQVPQYAVVGAAEVFTYIGLMELFYDEAPDAIRSLSGAIIGLGSALGSYLSALLVTFVNRFTSTRGHAGAWIPQDNLNLGHLDRFFWLLAGISAVNLFLFVWFARRYQYTAHAV